MSSRGHIWVNLHQPEGVAKVPIPVNERGELPAVLINPRDAQGRLVPGTWLAGRNGDAELTTCYEPLTPSIGWIADASAASAPASSRR